MKIKLTLIIVCYTTLLFSQKAKFIEKELSIPSKKVTVNGNLLVPTGDKKIPLVIIIPGSGVSDRDGNQKGSRGNSLKYLAQELAKNSIASYRYDKSAIAMLKSGKFKEEDGSFDDFIDDAKAVINYFKGKKQFSKIIFVGHSQGSLVGMIAAQGRADGYVSLAGAGRPIDKVITEQILNQSPMFKDDLKKTFDSLRVGKIDENFNPMLVSIFRNSLQPFWMSWMKYNPQLEIKKLNIPILIVNGTKDIQVPITDAELLHKATNKSQLELIENMNHVFKEVTVNDRMENIAAYNNTDLPTMQVLIKVITKFVNSIN